MIKLKYTLRDLKKLVDNDIELQVTKAHDPTLFEAVHRLSGVLGRYMVIYNQLIECCHQNLQVQKTVFIDNIIKALVSRILELRAGLEKLEGSRFQFIGHGLTEVHHTVFDIDMTAIPLEEGRPKHIQKEFDKILAKVKEIKEYVEEEVKFFYDIPKEGSIAIFKGDVPSPEDWYEENETRLQKIAADKKKNTQDMKFEAKRQEAFLKREELIKKRSEALLLKKMMKNPLTHPGYNFPISKTIQKLKDIIDYYHQSWDIYDVWETKEVKEKFVHEVDVSNAIIEVSFEVMPKVDEDMRKELTQLKQALIEDYKNLEREMPIDMTKPIIKREKKKKIARIELNSKVKKMIELLTLPHCFRPTFPFNFEIRAYWWERCREVNHRFHRILLVGPKGSGKDILVKVLASINDAVLFELDPYKVQGSLQSAIYLKKLAKRIVSCTRVLQPCVVHIKNVEKLFYKKSAPEDADMNFYIIKKYFVHYLSKHINKNNNITIVGSCANPWSAKSKAMLKSFPTVLLLPNNTYSTVVQILKDWVVKYEVLPSNFNITNLAYVLQGYSFGYLKEALERFMSADRIIKIAAYGITPMEVYDYIVNDENAAKVMPPRKDYMPEQMDKAIKAVRNGEKVAVAAKSFGVPRVTLYNKVSGKTPINCTMGPITVLSKDQEDILVRWLLALAEKHFPIPKDCLQDSVQKIISDQKISNPFANNRPGKKWCKSFLKRHPVLVEKLPEKLSKARDNVSEKDIKMWFQEIDGYLEKNHLKEIVEDPTRVFNADESAFFLSPKPGRVVAKKGDKHLYSACGVVNNRPDSEPTLQMTTPEPIDNNLSVTGSGNDGLSQVPPQNQDKESLNVSVPGENPTHQCSNRSQEDIQFQSTMSPKAIEPISNYAPVTEDEMAAIIDPIQDSIDPVTSLKHNPKSNSNSKLLTMEHPTTNNNIFESVSTPKIPNEVSSDGNVAIPGPSNYRDTITPQKNTLDAALGIIVPSPFKRNLFWPENEHNKKKTRIKREKIPSAVTSQAWREYHEKKEIEKKKLEQEKAERAKIRQEKKMLKEKTAEERKIKKQKTVNEGREDSDLDIEYAESGDSYVEEIDKDLSEGITKRQKRQPKQMDVPLMKLNTSKSVAGPKISLGCYVIVLYEGEYFPGKVENVNEKQYEVSTMTLSTGNSFRWPEKPDKIWYKEDQVIEKTDEPVCINKRGFYKIKEMDKYWNRWWRRNKREFLVLYEYDKYLKWYHEQTAPGMKEVKHLQEQLNFRAAFEKYVLKIKNKAKSVPSNATIDTETTKEL
ncbi:hypothetical protein HW555_009553 [Spodoptera exigua]|uniref:HTH CENPB-type domain-containing protein n=1 Tax=Spodoptera exigua TaxID=7107 RepID=A0A835GC64_SPOEX|nr:hypothetical protein HW555_009553 [Spodoptera exigua]